jgi:hypothetical protein
LDPIGEFTLRAERGRVAVMIHRCGMRRRAPSPEGAIENFCTHLNLLNFAPTDL